jgi:hypothetical protein
VTEDLHIPYRQAISQGTLRGTDALVRITL